MASTTLLSVTCSPQHARTVAPPVKGGDPTPFRSVPVAIHRCYTASDIPFQFRPAPSTPR